jgi:F-type H+-transporting ATPase subunit b
VSAALLRKLALGLLLTGVVANAVTARAASTQLALAWAAAPEQEREEHGNEAAEEKRELYYKIVNFAILAVALGYVLRKPVKEFFSQRSLEIVKALEEGRAALKESQAKLAVVEEKLRHLDEEIAAFKATSEKEMQQDRQRLREETAREAEKILQTAGARTDTAIRTAQLELKLYTAKEALRLAEQMIRERMDEPARARLVSQFIRTLDAGEGRS